MNSKPSITICWTLTEHDAASMLRLVNRELSQAEDVWQPYWQNLADSLRQAIQEANLVYCKQRCSAAPETRPDSVEEFSRRPPNGTLFR